MLSASPPAPIAQALLRKSVGLLTDERPRCAHCHRTPLVGERVYLYAHAIVCELCRPRRRNAPERSELVRSPEHKRAVRVRPRSVR
jgi:recombinational DNA repair protein (RecF pathway)